MKNNITAIHPAILRSLPHRCRRNFLNTIKPDRSLATPLQAFYTHFVAENLAAVPAKAPRFNKPVVSGIDGNISSLKSAKLAQLLFDWYWLFISADRRCRHLPVARLTRLLSLSIEVLRSVIHGRCTAISWWLNSFSSHQLHVPHLLHSSYAQA